MTPVLETARLLLRPLELVDAEQIQQVFPQWEVVRYLTVRVDEHEEGPSAMMRKADRDRDERGGGFRDRGDRDRGDRDRGGSRDRGDHRRDRDSRPPRDEFAPSSPAGLTEE